MGEARHHHYVPRCLLQGFAVPPTNGGRLFVLDVARNKIFPSSPAKCGHQRDYNRVSPETHPEPLSVEEFYAKIEAHAAPVLQQMRDTRKLPDKDGMAKILDLTAIQFSRTPRSRRLMEGKFFEEFERKVLEIGRDKNCRELFAEKQRKLGLPEQCWTSEGYLSFHKNGNFSTETDDNWKIAIALKQLPILVKVLRSRKWVLIPFSAANEPLIISDAGVGFLPLGKPGPKMIGLGLPNTIIYLPISSQIVLAGYFFEARQVIDRALRPRILNSCSFAYSLNQCFSSEDDFVIDDPDRGPTKWTTYHKEGDFPKLMADSGDLADVYASDP